MSDSRPTEDQTPKRHQQGGDVDHDLISQMDAYGDRYDDADLYQQIQQSQRKIPWWLVVMVGIVILLSIVLNAPFLGGREGDPLALLKGGVDSGFFDFGMIAALIYVGLGFLVIFWFTCWRKGA